MNTNAMQHPRTQWAIEAAMWAAIESSRSDGIGSHVARSAGGAEIITALHHRGAMGGFSFYKNGVEVTREMLAFLRGLK